MTIIIGAKDNSGKVWVASDTAITLDSCHLGSMKTQKWAVFGDKVVIAVAGTFKVTSTLQRLALDKKFVSKIKVDTFEEVLLFVDDLRYLLAEQGMTYNPEDEGDDAEYGTGESVRANLIIATQNAIYTVRNFALIELAHFTADGSGAPYAFGAFYAKLPDEGLVPDCMEDLLSTVIKAAGAFDNGCNQEVNILCLADLKGKPNADRDSRKAGSRKRRGS